MRAKDAFALVSVLAILALLLVLVLSISTVLHVETRSSASSKNLLTARENALLGLDTAMSQLQEYAGRDQAVTFPATTFYPTKDMNLPTASAPRQGKGDLFDNATYGYRMFAATAQSRSYLGTNAVSYLTPNERTQWDSALKAYWNGGNATSSRNPRWTGIMDASLRVDRATNPNGPGTALVAQCYESDPATKFGEPKRDQLPVWLVSGNEKFLIDQGNGTVADATGAVVATGAYPSGYQTPDVALPDPATDPTVVYLVGEGSATTNATSADGLDGRVKAKKQELKAADATVTGHYAYWVGDESTKANFAARDRTSTNDTTYPNDVSTTSVTYRNRLQVPQRVGWENLAGFGNATFSANDSNLENINTSMEIGLLEDTNTTAIKTAAKNNFHSLTAFSKSLLTDTALGGLKKDLTSYLERGQGLADSATIADPARYLTSDARFKAWGGTNSGFPNSSADALDGIPTWGQIKEWYSNAVGSGGSGQINPTATTAPILTYIMFHNGMSYFNPNAPALPDATHPGVVRLHWLPAIVLWNPYDASLASATYDLELGVSPLFNNMLFVNESPTLAELQQDVDADWHTVTFKVEPKVAGSFGTLTDPATLNVTLDKSNDGSPVDASSYSASRHPAGYGWIIKINSKVLRGEGGVEVFIPDTEIDSGAYDSSDPTDSPIDGKIKRAFQKSFTVFCGDHSLPNLASPFAPGDSGTPSYFTKFTSTPDSVDMRYGPWTRDRYNIDPKTDMPPSSEAAPQSKGNTNPKNYDSKGIAIDDDLEDGTTDAFGRYYYYVAKADPDMSVDYWPASWAPRLGALGAKVFLPRAAPHETGTDQGKAMALPVDRPLRFHVSAAFGPGEARIFTVGSDTHWTWNSTVLLTNQFDPTAPASLWFDFLSVANGPANAVSTIIRRCYSGGIQGGIAAPTVKFSLNGQTIFGSKAPLGDASNGGAEINARGRNYDAYRGYSTQGNADANGNGITNREEADPSFVSTWRRLYDFSEFANHMMTSDTDNSTSSIAGYGATWLTPLLGIGEADLHNYLPVLSRFNIGAKTYDIHPMVDGLRDSYGTNMLDYRGLREGFTKLKYVQSEDQNQNRWDDFQYNGDLAYSLILQKEFSLTYSPGGQPPLLLPAGDSMKGHLMPISGLAIRNAKRADSEILSLGQFQQVNLSPYFWEPAFPISSSDAAPYCDREAITGIHSRKVGACSMANVGYKPNNAFQAATATTAEIPGNSMLDLSYLLNENVWDRYFLSTITGTPDLTKALPNSRMRFSASTTSADETALQSFDTAAAKLETFGALNVNSTSVEAWKSLLTSFRNLKLAPQTGSPNADKTVPVTRSLLPIEDKVNFTLSNRTASDYGSASGLKSKNYKKMVSGFRFLDDAMIQALAERIVDEVKMRGPFLSMSDFVNRRLYAPAGSGVPGSPWHEGRTNGRVGFQRDGKTPEEPNSPDADGDLDWLDPSYTPFIGLQGLNGALQRAINLSGINGGVNNPILGPAGSLAGDNNDWVFSVRIKNSGGADQSGGVPHWTNTGIGKGSNTVWHHSIEPSLRGHLDNEHIAGSPAGEAGQLFQGSPGFVTQGDLLAMIGPALTPRGDTFLVRTYGDAVDKNGKVLSRAYLEAVVQRLPDPVNPAGTTGPDQWRPTDKFGRKFKIVKLRWLNPDEV